MSGYKGMAKMGLNNIKRNILIENVIYPKDLKERMHPSLEEDLINNKTSLGNHPCFPIGDERSFPVKIVSDRFKEVVNEVKKAFNVDEVDVSEIIKQMQPLVYSTMSLESSKRKELAELAVKMVKEEFELSDEVVIEAELCDSIESINKNETPNDDVVLEFEDHDEIEYANDSVYKRRFLNSMIQGASKKVNHMYHLADEELTNINPKLINNYKKMMSAADYTYFIFPDLDSAINGGSCDVDFGGDKDSPKLMAKALVFPVLIHELVKGCMEILSANGLPNKEKIAEYVINKSDYVQAEPWDMRIGPGIWGRFCAMMPPEDFNLKHHVYTELAQLEPKEFMVTMKEIMAGTSKGKNIISEILSEVKREISGDEYDEAMGDDLFNIEELF